MDHYNWQSKQWPHFTYQLSDIAQQKLYQYAKEASCLTSSINATASETEDALLELMVIEAYKTSEIEGELLALEAIRSSIHQQLGLPFMPESSDKRAQGGAALLLDVRKFFHEPLTETMLHQWHQHVMKDIEEVSWVGRWRDNAEPMQIISGPTGREKIFFEAPPSERISFEMDQFIAWYNTELTEPGPVRAAIAHLYFESIHPYRDGNGRVGRALVEKILSHDLGHPILFSISNTIMAHRKQYYHFLHANSRTSMDISSWVDFFIDMIWTAQMQAKDQISFVIHKSQFWRNHQKHLNPRQEHVLRKMMAKGPQGFEGGMSAKKYMTITSCSKATATRDLTDLLEKECLVKMDGSGPKTRYTLCF